MERAGRLIGKLKLAKDVSDPESRARAAWTVAAGPRIAEHTRVVGIVRQTLVVEVEDRVWQRQLNSLQHFLLRNLRAALGEDLVSELDLRPMPAAARRGPGRASTLRSSNGIEDPVLDALYSMSKKNLPAVR